MFSFTTQSAKFCVENTSHVTATRARRGMITLVTTSFCYPKRYPKKQKAQRFSAKPLKIMVPQRAKLKIDCEMISYI